MDTVVQAGGTREAEMAKLIENTYRHVNIALVNEMSHLLQRTRHRPVDAISCAATKPFGYQAFRPGPGVGGHCIPIDPNYLAHKVRTLGYPFRMVELAQEINTRMPRYVVERAQHLLDRAGKTLTGARVLLLGVTYKADIADQRETSARDVVKRLRPAAPTSPTTTRTSPSGPSTVRPSPRPPTCRPPWPTPTSPSSSSGTGSSTWTTSSGAPRCSSTPAAPPARSRTSNASDTGPASSPVPFPGA